MSEGFDSKRGRRIVVATPSGRHRQVAQRTRRSIDSPRNEALVAAGVIGAAALATLLALFITSRPYDPMNPSVEADQSVPPSATYLQPSPKPTSSVQPSPTPAPTTQPLGETVPAIPDDGAIQAEIERRIAEDASLANIDMNTIVEGGRVTLAGSVKTQDLKTRIERLVRSIKGVTSVDNQLAVPQSTPPGS